MAKRRTVHLYKGKKTRKIELRDFQKRYGKKKGKEVYGKVVGKVWRAQHPGKKSWNKGKHYTVK